MKPSFRYQRVQSENWRKKMSNKYESMTTQFVAAEDVERNWWIIDVSGQRLGRVATHIANLLRGKHKPNFTPHIDNGDFVVVINADKVEMTGTKWQVKKYYRHSRFFGSLKEKSAEQMKEFDPTFIIKDAVDGMLPENKLSYSLINKLKIYTGAEHPHGAQQPQPYKIKH
jgi:large subunit ribosomal protein L13